MNKIGERIKELIKAKDLTNTQFAQKIDVNPSIVSHILSGRNKVSLQVILQIKEAFPEVDVEQLLTGKARKDNNTPEFTNVNNDSSAESSKTTPINNQGFRQTNDISSKDKTIERVLILYSDKTVESFTP